VFAEDCNREYEGQVKARGDSIKILGIGKPTVRELTKGEANADIENPEVIEDASIHMQINRIAYFNYMIGDIDKVQAVKGIKSALSEETSEAIANKIDGFLASLAATKEAVKLTAAAQTVSETNVTQLLDDALQKLYENDVADSTQITVTVPPKFYFILKRAYAELDTDNSALIKNGRVGMYGKAVIKMSNNVASTGSGTTFEHHILVRTKRAIAFCQPLTHTEPYRPEKKFADAVKGFVLYDAKIVRPKELIDLNVKYSA
jgi:hypothetical protein